MDIISISVLLIFSSVIAGSLLASLSNYLDKRSEKTAFHINGRKIKIDMADEELTLRNIMSTADKPQAFISYSSKDKEFVSRLVNDFRKNNLRVWLMENELKLGDSITQKIEEGLQTSEYFFAVLSNSSLQSTWCEKEYQKAIECERQNQSPRVIPLVIEDCEIPSYMSDKYYADFRNDYETCVKKIIESIFEPTNKEESWRETALSAS